MCGFYFKYFNRFRYHPDLQHAYEYILDEFQPAFGQALKPTVDKLFTPWISLDGSWMQPAGTSRSTSEEVNPGNLLISPAPGEEFDLTIQVADQLLNFISGNIYIQVLCNTVFNRISPMLVLIFM